MLYPGACSLVFQVCTRKYTLAILSTVPVLTPIQSSLAQHIMEIFVEVLVAWDPVAQKSKKGKGILGPVEAWARTDEEQGRKTLHAHFLFWITGMNKCRRDFVYGSDEEREYARKAFAKYADEVMRASYPELRIKLPCCGFGEAKMAQEVVSEVDLQVRYSCISFLREVPRLPISDLLRRYATPVIRTNVSGSTAKFSSAKVARSRKSSPRRKSSCYPSIIGGGRAAPTPATAVSRGIRSIRAGWTLPPTPTPSTIYRCQRAVAGSKMIMTRAKPFFT